MSPVTGLVLLLASSCVSSSEPEYDPYPYEEISRTEKPGTCPKDVDYPTCDPLVLYRPGCRKDRDCKGTRKCCLSGCQNRCLLPVQVKANPCSFFDNSICIYVKPAPAECHSDSQCQGTDRCCYSICRYQCTPTVTVKPGQCPALKKKIIAKACTKDYDCPGNKKCCKQNGLKCVTPEKEHPGVCPISLENLNYIVLNSALCNRDSDCPPEKKCCLTEENNLQCQAVTNEKPGFCPAPSTQCLYPAPRPWCTCDADCPGNKKCCIPLCRQECTDPGKECPKVYPIVRCDEPYPSAECIDDSNCGYGQKCCEVGCRFACINV